VLIKSALKLIVLSILASLVLVACGSSAPERLEDTLPADVQAGGEEAGTTLARPQFLNSYANW
jgi:hypothetical protein